MSIWTSKQFPKKKQNLERSEMKSRDNYEEIFLPVLRRVVRIIGFLICCFPFSRHFLSSLHKYSERIPKELRRHILLWYNFKIGKILTFRSFSGGSDKTNSMPLLTREKGSRSHTFFQMTASEANRWDRISLS
jgi:hypothetical protein